MQGLTERLTGPRDSGSQGGSWAWPLPRASMTVGRGQMTEMTLHPDQPHPSCLCAPRPPCFPGDKWRLPVPRKLEVYWGSQRGEPSSRSAVSSALIAQRGLPGCLVRLVLSAPGWVPPDHDGGPFQMPRGLLRHFPQPQYPHRHTQQGQAGVVTGCLLSFPQDGTPRIAALAELERRAALGPRLPRAPHPLKRDLAYLGHISMPLT